MWSRRAACESITTRRRRLGVPFLAGAADAPSPLDSPVDFVAGDFVPSAFGAAFAFALAAGAAFFEAGFVFVAVALDFAEAPSPELFRAARASDSSTLDWAAFASTPAALSAARRSLLVRPWAFA